jgi:cysteine desulfurase
LNWREEKMTNQRAYLDHNATAPLLPEARDAMIAALDLAGNPSSVHAEGRKARNVIEEARRAVADLVSVKSEQVTFTSGATEAANLALTADYRMGRGPFVFSKLYVSAVEHPAVLSGGRFAKEDLVVLQVDVSGAVLLRSFGASQDGVPHPAANEKGLQDNAPHARQLETTAQDKAPHPAKLEERSRTAPPPTGRSDSFALSLEEALAGHDKSLGLPLVAIQLANNESGVIQPISEISAIVKLYGGILIVDAVQAPGRIPFDMSDGYADFLILSAHKMGGPKGIGALISFSTLLMPSPLQRGGGQEKGHRAGTEALPLIAGFGAAARVAKERLLKKGDLLAKRDAVEAIILRHAPDAIIHGAGVERLPNTVFFTIPGLKAETLQIAFDLSGVALSAGSACSSGRLGASHVLEAMGLGNLGGALRVSIGHETTEADLALFESALRDVVSRRAARAA